MVTRLLTVVAVVLAVVEAEAQSLGVSVPATKAIVGASVVSLEGGGNVTDAVVVISGERITAVGPASTTPVPPGAEVIRLPGKWILPGLMNLHAHFGLILPGRQAVELANESEAALALRMAVAARDTVYAGVTTVRMTGDNLAATNAVMRAIDQGAIDGPRIFSAGEILTVTGGHGARRGQETADGPDALRRAVRQRIAGGASWIKIAISGGIADERGAIGASHMTKDEIAAVTDTAHRHGVKVTAHSGSTTASDEAIDAGIDCIEHGYYLTETLARKMKATSVWLVPTIVVSRKTTLPFFERIGSPQWYLDRVLEVGQHHWASLQTAIREGVRIAMGTDQLPAEPNDGTTASVREIQFYVEAGMTPIQAIRAATADAAELLGIAGTVGTVNAGKAADLIAIDRDPTRDIAALRSIGFVMKGGRVIRNDWSTSTKSTSAASR